MKFVKPERLMIRGNPELDEKWVQARLGEDPSLLGLGDLVLRDRERPQPGAGRLDLLLQDPETDRRYEVELQLGTTDESHIIRTIEYWDIERGRYPQYDHCAVIVAEEISSRFLNVISLFNHSIPLIAIQMHALKLGDSVALVFTTVLNEFERGLVGEDEEVTEVVDRAYWEERGTKETLAATDRVLEIVRKIDAGLEPTFKQQYIGLANKNGKANNFAIFYPQKHRLLVKVRAPQSGDTEAELTGAGLDFSYDGKAQRYGLRLSAADISKSGDVLADLLAKAHAST